MFASKARCGLTPLRCGFLVGSAVSGLRSLSRLWGGLAFALCARGLGCSPPRLATARHRSARFFGGLRESPGGQSHLFTQKGPLYTISMTFNDFRGNGPALAGRRWGGGAIALCARGWGDRLQCSLRPDSAAAWVGVWLGQKVERGEKEAPDLTRNTATPQHRNTATPQHRNTASGQRFVDLICRFG